MFCIAVLNLSFNAFVRFVQRSQTSTPYFLEHSRMNLFNPLVLELDIYSLAHHLCKMLILYEPRKLKLGNTRHFVEE